MPAEPNLERLYEDLGRGRFPPADGSVDVVRPSGRVQAVLAFTAHSVVVTDLEPTEVLAELDPSDPGSSMSPGFLAWLGQRVGRLPGALDCVLVHNVPRPVAPLELVRRDDLGAHPRVARAHHLRDDVVVFTDRDARGLVTLGRGIGGRLDVSFEVDELWQNARLGRALLSAALARCPAGEPLFAEVAPGNARSLRAVLACGFRPVGSEVLFGPA